MTGDAAASGAVPGEQPVLAHAPAPPCPACESEDRRLVGRKRGFPTFECGRCGTLASLGDAADEERRLYGEYYDQAATYEVPEAAALSLRRLVRSCEGYRRGGRWLDVGYGPGGLLRIAEEGGWSCFGVELSPVALELGRQRGWTVTEQPETDDRFPPHGFDVVSMIEFLEHVESPAPFLRAASRWLRPGGFLYLTTPNAASLNRRVLGLQWSVFSPPEHRVIWTGAGIRRALSRAGFSEVGVRTEGLNPSEILARLRRTTPAVPRNTAGFALNAAFSTTPSRRVAKRCANAVLSAFGIGDTLKVRAIARGSGAQDA